ncbi:septum site-determining protein MinC [Alicyclobacillus mengziensis]|uniref:Probable septum site-determining protein MinC n=1 Tax=Alicyclobacillus mengziensis TaxID=2931921 RepID=A0A9X7VVL5_9BACL|nr:septum site-determining protein MinC [Alicyclobacillus mengziensis]QSO45913.1 septation ring formation regulator EzrA [Alicyclobacillus mengziensis]
MVSRMTEQRHIEQKPPVAVKGIKAGLLFIIDEHCAHSELIAHLSEMFHGELSSMFSGPETNVYVDYGNRLMSIQETRDLITLFIEKENFILREFGAHTTARRSLFYNHSKEQDSEHIFKGTVRAGQQLVFKGDVVIIGDVNAGGEVAATGDVYILGRLRGIVHAGMDGDESAIIAAAEFSPMQLKIADWVSRAPESDGQPLQTFMEFAYLREDGMAVDKLLYVHSIRKELQNAR